MNILENAHSAHPPIDTYPPIVGRINPILIYKFKLHIFPNRQQYNPIQIHVGARFPGAQFAAPKYSSGEICRGLICRGPICQWNGKLGPRKWGAQFAGSEKRGPICRGPICRGPICLEPTVFISKYSVDERSYCMWNYSSKNSPCQFVFCNFVRSVSLCGKIHFIEFHFCLFGFENLLF